MIVHLKTTSINLKLPLFNNYSVSFYLVKLRLNYVEIRLNKLYWGGHFSSRNHSSSKIFSSRNQQFVGRIPSEHKKVMLRCDNNISAAHARWYTQVGTGEKDNCKISNSLYPQQPREKHETRKYLWKRIQFLHNEVKTSTQIHTIFIISWAHSRKRRVS